MDPEDEQDPVSVIPFGGFGPDRNRKTQKWTSMTKGDAGTTGHSARGALPTFSGHNDLYDVAEFFAEFEELTRAVSADATQCLLLLRRSLRSTAKLVMRGAMAQSYEELTAKLLQEFRFCLTLEQVYARLRSADAPPFVVFPHCQASRNVKGC